MGSAPALIFGPEPGVSYSRIKLLEIQKALRETRESLGLKQGDLSAYTGIPRSTVSALETKSDSFPFLALETLRIFLAPTDSAGKPITRETLLNCLTYPDWYEAEPSPLIQSLESPGRVNLLSQAIKRQIYRDNCQGQVYDWIQKKSVDYGFDEKRLVDLMNGSGSASPSECHRLWLFVKDDDDNRNPDWLFNLCGHSQLKEESDCT